jgi:hypothetical protein
MTPYLIKNNHNEFRILPIEEIFKWIKDNPQHIYYKKLENDSWEEIHKPFVLQTQFICHRINTITELIGIPKCFGVEIDIRENQKKKGLMLAHDPYEEGNDLKKYLEHYRHSLLIANIKSERIEEACLDYFRKFQINNYFFLDSSFPMMVSLSKCENTNFAVRFSEFEPLPYLYSKWIWVDCFSKSPLNYETFQLLRSDCRKVCIVSPELQKRSDDIYKYRLDMIKNNIIPDAICCKFSNIFEWI